MKNLGLSFLFLVFCFSCSVQGSEDPYVVLVSFDGFSHDYVSKYETPQFDAFIKSGSSAERMIPSYPSKTFPNHYSLVTGLRPGSHGLVDNTFFDRDRQDIYRIGDRSKVEDAYYYGGLPLWQLGQQHGMKSASYFWVGSEAPVAGSFPDYYHIYDGSVSNETRIDQVFTWLDLPDNERPRFVTLYFSFIDDVGHRHGPDAAETDEAVREADRLLGLLMEGVEASSLDINVILVSDHGMYPMVTRPETFIILDDLIDSADTGFLAINNGTHAHVYSKMGNTEKIDSAYNAIKNSGNHGFKVYKKGEFPEKWDYNHDRTGDIIIVADPGKYLIYSNRDTSTWEENWGTHGFDPYEARSGSMSAIFYANGPNILKGTTVGAIDNVDIYPFIGRILGLTIPQIDGSIGDLESIYKN